MSSTNTPFAAKALCLLLTSAHVLVHAGPAQIPLLTASEGPKPNVVLTLDDSGSMNWLMMPDNVGQISLYEQTTQYTKLTTIPSGSTYNRCRTTAFQNLPTVITGSLTIGGVNYSICYASGTVYVESDSGYQLYPKTHNGDHDGNGRNYSGTVDTNAVGYNNVPNIYGARFRSAAINGSYYNPNTEYVPWPAGVRNLGSSLVNTDGTIKDYTKVPIDPTVSNSATVNLAQNVSSVSSNWCASGFTAFSSTRNGYVCPSASRAFQPAVYFNLKAGKDGTSYDDFERVDINSIADATLKAKQLKNYVTWFTYYRSRILNAKGAVGLAFDRQPEKQFRLGWGSINNGTSSPDGYTNKTMREPVRSFDTSRKTSLNTWLRGLDADGGTPLRQAMQDVGKYFTEAGAVKSGSTITADPYRTDPTNKDQSALSCRRNFHILVTDGYWNTNGNTESLTSVGDQDGKNGSEIKGTNPVRSFTYKAQSPYSASTTDVSNSLADFAMYYWVNDLRGDLDNNLQVKPEATAAPYDPSLNPAFWQHMVSFTVGMGVDGTIPTSSKLGTFNWPAPKADQNTTIDDLWHAAVNSRGQYLKATDPIAFAESLGSILSNITATGGTVSGVAVSRSSLGSEALKLVPTFEPDKWSGDLTAQKLDAQGNVVSTAWTASRKVPAFGARNIWMGKGSSAAKFTLSNLPSGDNLALGHISTTTSVGVAPTLDSDLINYLRGDTSQETSKFRPRKSNTWSDGSTSTNVLGSFVNSLPVYVMGMDFQNRYLPSTVSGKSTGSGSYQKYVSSTKRVREGLVLIGGNDGMLHGFRESDGVEVFAYIPKAVLKGETHPSTTGTSNTNLYGLARLASRGYESLFFVDGQIAEGDISTCSGDSCSWRNIAVASAGGGAKSVFALDVTTDFKADAAAAPSSFNASNVKWELGAGTDAAADLRNHLGYVMSTPEIGMLPSGQWVVIFGNGYDSTSGRAALIMVDANTGAVVKTILAGTETGNGLGGVSLVRDATNVIVQAYAGDLKGNVWKFDLSGTSSSDWKVDLGGVPLFTATKNGVAQPITAAPGYTLHPKNGLMVIVPTGKLYETADASSGSQQTIYGLWDQAVIGKPSTASAAIVANKLSTQVVQVTNQSTKSSTATFKIVEQSKVTDSRGWRLDMLFADGERGIYAPQFVQGFVMVESVLPGKTDGESCSLNQGSGYAYLLNPFSGGQSNNPLIDLNGDGLFNADDAWGVFRRSDVGQSAVQGGAPKGKIQCTGNNCNNTQGDTLPPDRLWRQIFRPIN